MKYTHWPHIPSFQIALMLMMGAIVPMAQPIPPTPLAYVSNTNTNLSITLAWDPSPDPGIDSYRIHYGTNSGQYGFATNAGLNTNLTVTGLIQGQTYFFAATAIGTNQLESDFSNEVQWVAPEAVRPPTLKTILLVTPMFETSMNGRDWQPAGDGPEVVFAPPDAWDDTGFVRVQLKFRRLLKTSSDE